MSTVILPDINQNRMVKSSKEPSSSERRGHRNFNSNLSSRKTQNGGASLSESMNQIPPSLLTNSQSLVALRSIDKYYKSNDVHDILGHEKESYPGLPTSKKLNQEAEVDGNLKSLKKSFNVLRSKSDQREKEIQNMRNEIDNFKTLEIGMSSRIGGADTQLQQLTTVYETTKQQQLEAEMNKKTYDHMISRMKKDIIAYRLKAYETEDTLQLGESVFLNATTKQQQIVQKEGKAQQALNQVIKAKEFENQEREQYLDSYKHSLEEQNELERQRDERVKRQQEIAEIAANDIRDLNLKKWRKLLLVNTFLDSFLKRKMESEMKRYSSVEQSFQKIKASTGVHDAGEIVHKFLKREQTYSSLLISISEYEKKIDNLKKNNGSLQARLHQLKQEVQPLERSDQNKQDKLQMDEIYQKYTETAAKSENCYLVEDRAYHWMLRTLMKLNRCMEGEAKDKEEYEKEYPREKLADLLQMITSTVTKGVGQLNSSSEADSILKQIASTHKQQQDTDTMRRMNRVRPILVGDQSAPNNASFERPSYSVDHMSHNSIDNIDQNESLLDLSEYEQNEENNVDQLRKETKEMKTKYNSSKAVAA